MAREPQPLLHNMSAPPRAQIGFRAVRPSDGPPEQNEAVACGLRWLARLAPAELIRLRSRTGVAADQARLRLSLARAQAEVAGWPLPRRLPAAIARLPLEAVADALRAIAGEVTLASLGLPAFGLLLPARGEPRPHERSVRITVAVLARRRGSVFLRDAEPLAIASLDGPMLDLWAPTTTAGEEGACRAS
jgi:hypothetical protein